MLLDLYVSPPVERNRFSSILSVCDGNLTWPSYLMEPGGVDTDGNSMSISTATRSGNMSIYSSESRGRCSKACWKPQGILNLISGGE